MESYGEVKIGSPQIKRKVIKDDSDSDDEDLFEKKSFEKKANTDLVKPLNTNVDKHLHEELMAIFKSIKNKDKMIDIIEQTFKFRRSIIENGNSQFFDLLEQFKYLTDIKNVRIFV